MLGQPVPDEPWPRAYPTADFEEHIDMALKGAMWKGLRWVGVCIAVLMAWFAMSRHASSY